MFDVGVKDPLPSLFTKTDTVNILQNIYNPGEQDL